MRLPWRRSETRSAALRTERWREIEGPEMGKQAAISPAASSRSFNSWRIWRRVGSARARKMREVFFIVSILAILLNSVKQKDGQLRAPGAEARFLRGVL